MDLDIGPVRARRELRWVGPVRRAAGSTWFALKVVVALAVPYFLLVRASVYAYQDLGWGTWSSLATGVFATGLLYAAYARVLWRATPATARVGRVSKHLLIAVVGGYAVYALLFVSARSAGTHLHPIVRLGAAPFLLIHRDAVVTDPERTVEDYLRIGLPAGETSLHFGFNDRFVRALDVRTAGRSEKRNRRTAGYFRSLGFATMRSVGEVDHLHVSLLGGVRGG